MINHLKQFSCFRDEVILVALSPQYPEAKVASLAPQMLVKPWHDFDEVAGLVAIIQLMKQNLIPPIAASAG